MQHATCITLLDVFLCRKTWICQCEQSTTQRHVLLKLDLVGSLREKNQPDIVMQLTILPCILARFANLTPFFDKYTCILQ